MARLIFALAAADKTRFLTRVASRLAEHEIRIPFFGAAEWRGYDFACSYVNRFGRGDRLGQLPITRLFGGWRPDSRVAWL